MSIYTEDGGCRMDSIKRWEYFYFDCLLSTKTTKVGKVIKYCQFLAMCLVGFENYQFLWGGGGASSAPRHLNHSQFWLPPEPKKLVSLKDSTKDSTIG